MMPKLSKNAVHEALARMVAIVREHGGFVHPEFEFSVDSNGISAVAPAHLKDEVLVDVPLHLLVPAEFSGMHALGDQLVCANAGALHREDSCSDLRLLSSVQIEILNLFLTIYNHQEMLLWAQQHLLQAQNGISLSFKAAFAAIKPDFGLNEEPSHELFLKTRFLYVSAKRSEGIFRRGLDNRNEAVRVLMPIIDFFNHHPKGSGFRVRENGLSIRAALGSELEDSKNLVQMYACYGGFRDVLQMAIKYGYVDEQIPYVYSAPFSWFDEDFGDVHVLGERVRSKNKFHLPAVNDEQSLCFSHLLFNAEQSSYLWGTVQLIFLRRGMRMGLSKSVCALASKRFFQALVNHNLAFYTALQNEVQRTSHELTPALCIINEACVRSMELISYIYEREIGSSESLDVK